MLEPSAHTQKWKLSLTMHVFFICWHSVQQQLQAPLFSCCALRHDVLQTPACLYLKDSMDFNSHMHQAVSEPIVWLPHQT